MRLLGAVLAGGRSRRFGSDKAMARIDGRSLLDHAVAALAPQCEALVVVGRTAPGLDSVDDCPEPGRGPLGAIAGALQHAAAGGYDAVLTCGVDSLGLPPDLAARLSPAPAYVGSQPIVGVWPVTALVVVQEILAGLGPHSMRALAARIGAREVMLPWAPANINTPADLAAAAEAFRPGDELEGDRR